MSRQQVRPADFDDYLHDMSWLEDLLAALCRRAPRSRCGYSLELLPGETGPAPEAPPCPTCHTPNVKQLAWLARAALAASCKAEEDAAWQRLHEAAMKATVPVRIVVGVFVVPGQCVAAIVRRARSVWREHSIDPR